MGIAAGSVTKSGGKRFGKHEGKKGGE